MDEINVTKTIKVNAELFFATPQDYKLTGNEYIAVENGKMVLIGADALPVSDALIEYETLDVASGFAIE